MSFSGDLHAMVRRVVAKTIGPPVVAHGTLTTRPTATSATVTFSASAVAVPVLIPGDLAAVAGDRVGLVKFGSDWCVVVAFPEHP